MPGCGSRVTYHVGDAVDVARARSTASSTWSTTTSTRRGYPDAWRAARERIRVGGLYICDNVALVQPGRVLDDHPRRAHRAILEHNALVAEDERYVSTIVPTRDGVMVALRASA